MKADRVEEAMAPYGLRTAMPAPPARVVLHGIRWSTFEALLKDTGDDRKCRFAYDRGVLEIMSPLNRHENFNRLFEHMLLVLCKAFNLGMYSSGSFTCKREDLKRGIEPDSCFYIQNEPLVRAKDDIDLENDPPPDLMIEIDIFNSSTNKLSICEALGVREHWRYNGSKLQIRILKSGSSIESAESLAFPGISIADAFRKLRRDRAAMGQTSALTEFRKWVRKELRTKRK